MANYGSKDIVFTLTDAGAVARDITQHVRQINGIDVEAMTEESHAFGDSWGEFLYSGFSKLAEITLSGFYDDAATTTPYALFVRGATRQFVVTWGGGHTTTFSVILKKWSRSPELEKVHKYTLVMQPTGAVVEA